VQTDPESDVSPRDPSSPTDPAPPGASDPAPRGESGPPSSDGRPLPAPAPAADRDLDRPDALTRYMAELRRHPPISREEEHALAVRWVEEGDVDAARQLVVSNLRLVVKIAMEYRRAWTNVLDLIQEGNVGLMQAVRRFDPYRGVKLSSYAAYWIRAYLLRYILDNFRIVRLGTTRAQRKLFFRLNKEKRELERLGFEAEPRLLAERLDVSEDDVRDMEQRLTEGDVSMNAPLGREEGRTEFGDLMPGGGAGAEADVGDEELRRVFREHVHDFAESLDERDRRIMDERILAEEPRTLREIGDDLGLTRERVRQLEARIVSRLREYLKEKMVDFEYYGPPAE